jgi:hypothetical protein
VWPRRGRRAIPPIDPLPLVIVGTFTAIYCVYFGDSRFHHPLIPWIAIYAAGLVGALGARQGEGPPVPLQGKRAAPASSERRARIL